MNKIALLTVDMQNAYFNNGALEQKRTELIASCNMLIDYAHRHDFPIFNIRTVHKSNKTTWTRNMLEDGQGYLFDDDKDTENISGLQLDNTTELIKTRDSAFHDTSLDTMLRTIEVSTLIICGVSTHSCILLTAADAYALNFKVIIARDAVATHDPTYHDYALRIMSQEYRQKVLSNKDITSSEY